MAPTIGAEQLVNHQRKKLVAFADGTRFEPQVSHHHHHGRRAAADEPTASGGSGNYGLAAIDAPESDDDAEEEQDHAANVVRDEFGNLPAKQGLYNPDEEKDACG